MLAWAGAATGQPAAGAGLGGPSTTVMTGVGARLDISPKRVLFLGPRRSASVIIQNRDPEAVTFEISLVDRVMLADGTVVTLDDAMAAPDQKPTAERVHSAKARLRVSPRRVTLAPGAHETLRVLLDGPPGEARGEFRTHLTVTALPPPDTGLTAEQAAAGARVGSTYQLTSLYAFSIPLIIRVGAPDVRAGLENPQLQYLEATSEGPGPRRTTPTLKVELVRAGVTSLFGNIEVRSRDVPGDGALGLLRGVGVYPEIERRFVRIPLSRAPKPGERLEVRFVDDDTAPGMALAVAEVPEAAAPREGTRQAALKIDFGS